MEEYEEHYDRNIRKNGTILSLLKNDILSIIQSQTPFKVMDNSHFPLPQKWSYFSLEKNELNMFDLLEVRSTNTINSAIPPGGVAIIFYASQGLSLTDKLDAFNELHNLYGIDSCAKGRLTAKEIKELKDGSWIGRYWYFNQYHSLYNSSYPGDFQNYSVTLENEGENGLKLTINQFRRDLCNT